MYTKNTILFYYHSFTKSAIHDGFRFSRLSAKHVTRQSRLSIQELTMNTCMDEKTSNLHVRIQGIQDRYLLVQDMSNHRFYNVYANLQYNVTFS